MRTISPDEVPEWIDNELFAPDRERPIVAITTDFRSKEFLLEPEDLESRVSDLAEVVAIPTGEATWTLSEALPAKLDVYGGAMRVWWPGLTRESNPYDHKLFLATNRDEAVAAAERIGRALREWSGEPDCAAPAVPPIAVEVTGVEPTIDVVDAQGRHGRVTEADVPLHALSICLRAGTKLDAVRLDPTDERSEGLRFSLVGQIPSPWDRIGSELTPGDIVFGRIVAIQDRWTLVELLPSARGIVGIAEIDHSFVESIADFVEIDEIVKVRIQSIDPDARRAVLSIKEAITAKAEPLPSPSLVAGGAPFDWFEFLGRSIEDTEEVEDGDDEARIDGLKRQLRAANDDRALLRDTVARLRRELRSLEDRFGELQRLAGPDLDPLKGERSFLRAVRVAHARDVEEDERADFLLGPMRVGPSFLETARDLEDVPVDKLVDVAAQIAAGKVQNVEGREVHALGADGPATDSAGRVRERDGAKAWRCSLQMNEPESLRMLWWSVPSEAGDRIEFASVNEHDDFDIPE
ncbi:MAG: S1 RNA-binding domain-containing protein [Planctomycetota bacterium]